MIYFSHASKIINEVLCEIKIFQTNIFFKLNQFQSDSKHWDEIEMLEMKDSITRWTEFFFYFEIYWRHFESNIWFFSVWAIFLIFLDASEDA